MNTLTDKKVNAKTSQEALESAKLNWKVRQSTVHYEGLNGFTALGNKKVNWRDDTGLALGVVGDGYTVLQNSDAFKFLDSVVGSMEAMYVNAGSFKQGAKIYVQAILPGYIRFDGVGGDDVGEKLLTFITSHDGSLPVSVLFTPTRIVCMNTLIMALDNGKRKTSLRHTSSLAIGLDNAKKTLGILNAQFSLLEEMSAKLIKTPFDEKQMPDLLNKTGLIKEKGNETSTRSLNIINEVLNKYHFGKGSDLSSAKGTAWGAYNAVSEYVDHFRTDNADKRAESALLGSGAEAKKRAFEVLMTA